MLPLEILAEPEAASTALAVKSAVQRGIQRLHHRAFDRGVPSQLALYFHALDHHHQRPFEQAVRHFQNEGFRVVAGPDAFLDAEDGERVLWLSFDDNFRSWYAARPLFDRLGVRCTFYVNTGVFRDQAPLEARRRFFRRIEHQGEARALTTDELVALRQDGHTVGAHTHTHPVLSQVAPAHAQAEIRKSKEVLEALLDEPVEHFAYPFGLRRYFDDRLIDYCRRIGLRTVARAIPALQHMPQGPVVLHRHGWRFERSFEENLADLRVDGRLFERLTGRSAVG